MVISYLAARIVPRKPEKWLEDFLNAAEVRDGCAFRVPKTSPAYFGTHDRFDEIIRYMERYENLFLVGGYGMHEYNNQDHSMLTAMVSVDNIIQGTTSKANLWEVNTEQEYHEARTERLRRVIIPWRRGPKVRTATKSRPDRSRLRSGRRRATR